MQPIMRQPLNYADIWLNYKLNKQIQNGCVTGMSLSSAVAANYFAINGT
jgi:hypothetical protein